LNIEERGVVFSVVRRLERRAPELRSFVGPLKEQVDGETIFLLYTKGEREDVFVRASGAPNSLVFSSSFFVADSDLQEGSLKKALQMFQGAIAASSNR
jgi:hypothetical protein